MLHFFIGCIIRLYIIYNGFEFINASLDFFISWKFRSLFSILQPTRGLHWSFEAVQRAAKGTERRMLFTAAFLRSLVILNGLACVRICKSFSVFYRFIFWNIRFVENIKCSIVPPFRTTQFLPLDFSDAWKWWENSTIVFEMCFYFLN